MSFGILAFRPYLHLPSYRKSRVFTLISSYGGMGLIPSRTLCRSSCISLALLAETVPRARHTQASGAAHLSAGRQGRARLSRQRYQAASAVFDRATQHFLRPATLRQRNAAQLQAELDILDYELVGQQHGMMEDHVDAGATHLALLCRQRAAVLMALARSGILLGRRRFLGRRELKTRSLRAGALRAVSIGQKQWKAKKKSKFADASRNN